MPCPLATMLRTASTEYRAQTDQAKVRVGRRPGGPVRGESSQDGRGQKRAAAARRREAWETCRSGRLQRHLGAQVDGLGFRRCADSHRELVLGAAQRVHRTYPAEGRGQQRVIGNAAGGRRAGGEIGRAHV